MLPRTNVFYHAYCPTENENGADWLLERLGRAFQGVTSEWMLVEMFRALKKQANLGVVSEDDANLVLDFFLSEIGEMVSDRRLQLIPVSVRILMASRKLIFQANLYAADAVHAATAREVKADCFITFDKDFREYLVGIPVLNPSDPSFRSIFQENLR